MKRDKTKLCKFIAPKLLNIPSPLEAKTNWKIPSALRKCSLLKSWTIYYYVQILERDDSVKTTSRHENFSIIELCGGVYLPCDPPASIMKLRLINETRLAAGWNVNNGAHVGWRFALLRYPLRFRQPLSTSCRVPRKNHLQWSTGRHQDGHEQPAKHVL